MAFIQVIIQVNFAMRNLSEATARLSRAAKEGCLEGARLARVLAIYMEIKPGSKKASNAMFLGSDESAIEMR